MDISTTFATLSVQMSSRSICNNNYYYNNNNDYYSTMTTTTTTARVHSAHQNVWINS